MFTKSTMNSKPKWKENEIGKRKLKKKKKKQLILHSKEKETNSHNLKATRMTLPSLVVAGRYHY